MFRAAPTWSAALVFGVAVVVSVGRSADEDVDPKVVKEAGKTLEKLARDMDKMKADDVKKVGDDMAKKYGLDQVMYNLKTRAKHGLGVGPATASIKPDGIELKFNELSKEALAPATVAKEAPALIQAARVTAALARVIPSFPEPPVTPPPPAGTWGKLSKEMQKGSEDLEAALKKGDPKSIQTAATKVYSSCVECHKIYR
jgi:hypothetical protein